MHRSHAVLAPVLRKRCGERPKENPPPTEVEARFEQLLFEKTPHPHTINNRRPGMGTDWANARGEF